MPPRLRRFSRDSLCPLLAALLALCVFLPGIGWGLPSRDDDRFLFGDRTPWDGGQIIALAGGFEAAANRGADVDANPLDHSSGAVILNTTDKQRAEIVRRFRLQSHQPDEFINFTAIAGMGQRRDLDPKLYQYGGLWLYPVAGLLGAAHVVGYVHLTGDLAWYLDRPGEFGKFYVVARLYSAAWGAAGAAMVFVLARRLAGSSFAGLCAAMAYALLPVVVTAAHEAKPHLAGAVLTLWAVLKAHDYTRAGRRRDALLAGALCGAASAMVVSMVVGFVILPVMGHLRWWQNRDRDAGASGEIRRPVVLISTALATAVGVAVYSVTNPFVIWNLLTNRSVFQSNISNSTAMYGLGSLAGGVVNAAMIFALATGFWFTLAAGAVFLAALVRASTAGRARRGEDQSLTWLLLAASAAVLVYYVPLAAGKPAEYARFGLVPAIALVVLWFQAAAPLVRWGPKGLWALAPILAALGGVPYLVNFLQDSGPADTRLRAAGMLEAQGAALEPRRLYLPYEPAPWSAPPFDLWAWEARLGNPEGLPRALVSLPEPWRGTSDFPTVRGRFLTPISWANKAIGVWVQRPDPPAEE